MKALSILPLTLAWVATLAHAQTDWGATARGDVEAAYEILENNHPGTVPEVADTAFVRRLEAGRAAGLASAERARDFPGYVDAMRAFARALDDPHIQWGPTAQTAARTPPAPREPQGFAGLGTRNGGGGVWIAMQSMDGRAGEMVRQLAQRPEILRDTPRIIVDLRGNTGGDSSVGERLAIDIYGEEAVRTARRTPRPGCPGAVWRASVGNLAAVRTYPQRFAQTNPAFAQESSADAERISAAMARGAGLSRDVPAECFYAADRPPPPPSSKKVLLLTDGACMSSCMMMVDLFRRLGAVQAGRTTRAFDWYMESRTEPLPSGLGVIGVVQKIGLAMPKRIEPFRPQFRYEGDIADTPSIERWIAGLKF